MPRQIDRRSSLDFEAAYAAAGNTTITHNYDLSILRNGEFPVQFVTKTGNGYVDPASVTKDEFVVTSPAGGTVGIIRMEVTAAEY